MHYLQKALRKHPGVNPDRHIDAGGPRGQYRAIVIYTMADKSEKRVISVRDKSRWKAHVGARQAGRYVQTGTQIHRKPRYDRG